jgi:hypothetical protein
VLAHQQLVQLVAHPLGRHDGQALPHGPDCSHRVVGGPEAEHADEAEEAQHAQRVVLEGNARVQRGAQQARPQVGQAAVGVDDLRGGHQAKGGGVHREVAP